MKEELTLNKSEKLTRISRYAYIIYLVLVIYLAIKGDYEWALANLGIALVFDPFDITVKWQQRPFYQKAWLIIHLFCMFGGLTYLLILKAAN